jgi:branched-chain amino acid transport system permease protein
MLDTSVVIAIYSLLALSVGITYGAAGILSVAQASFAALGAYITAILSIRSGLSPWLCGAIAIVLPAAFAYPFARLVTRLSPLALAIATLMFGYAFDIALREGGDLTGGYIGISGIPGIPLVGTSIRFHVLAWSVVALTVLGYKNLLDSNYGAALRTIRHDALRAAADGVSVDHMRSVALSLGAGVAGAGGWLYAHYITYIGPDSLNPAMSLSVLLMAVIGGSRSVLGPVVGAAALTLIFKLIPSQETVGMFYGAALILCLLIAPNGIMGVRWFARRASGTARKSG